MYIYLPYQYDGRKFNLCTDYGINAQAVPTQGPSPSVVPQKPTDCNASTTCSQGSGSTVFPSVVGLSMSSQYHRKPVKDVDIVVDWNGSDDPDNPRNWTKNRRWIITLVVSLFTFIRFV